MNYRYELTRVIGQGERICNFIMLNPSIADEVTDDPTIRRCFNYANDWGYDKLVVTNIYALRATNPSMLKHAFDPIGRENNAYIKAHATSASLIVCAWGNHGVERGVEVRRLLYGLPLHILGITNKGQPVHPLYQRTDVRPRLYDEEHQKL